MQKLNTRMLLKRLMGDADLVKMVLTEYFKDLPNQVNNLKEYVEHADFAAVAAQAHKMKGAAGNVGAEQLEVLMQKFEEAAQEKHYSNMLSHLSELDSLFVDMQKSSVAILN